MAGFREFVTGEVLTAANVDDFLMKQSVQKYADAAARDAALGTAVAGGNALREGMVAWLDDDDELIAYDGTAWNPVGTEPPAGIGSNVVQTVKTDTFATTSTTFVDVTDFDVTITPTLATSKVLLVASFFLGGSGQNAQGKFFRDSTDLGLFVHNDLNTADLIRDRYPQTVTYLDSPATTSAVVYKLQVRQTGGVGAANVFFSRSNSDATATVSTITAIEVAA